MNYIPRTPIEVPVDMLERLVNEDINDWKNVIRDEKEAFSSL